jgi:hypothetical protein
MTEESKEPEALFGDDSDSEGAAEGSAAGGNEAPTGGLGSKTSPVTPVEVKQEFINNLNVGRGATEPYDPAVLIAMVTYFVGNLVLIGNVTPETRDAIIACGLAFGHTMLLHVELPGMYLILHQVTNAAFIQDVYLAVLKLRRGLVSPASPVDEMDLEKVLPSVDPQHYERLRRRCRKFQPFIVGIQIKPVWDLVQRITQNRINRIYLSDRMVREGGILSRFYDSDYPEYLVFPDDFRIVHQQSDLGWGGELQVEKDRIYFPEYVGTRNEAVAQVTKYGQYAGSGGWRNGPGGKICRMTTNVPVFQVENPKTDEDKLLVFWLRLYLTLEPLVDGW